MFSRDNKALQLAMSQKDLRLDATSREMLQERQQVRVHIRTIIYHYLCMSSTFLSVVILPPPSFPQVHDLKVELRTMKAGLHNTSQFILEPKELKEAVKELYRKHLHDYDQVGREGREGRVEGHSLSSHDYDMSYTCY